MRAVVQGHGGLTGDCSNLLPVKPRANHRAKLRVYVGFSPRTLVFQDSMGIELLYKDFDDFDKLRNFGGR